MDVINQPVSWFRSQAGADAFASCTSLEDRIIFLYSYLKIVADPKVDTSNFLFKSALFFADAVHSSDVAYAAYDKLVDPCANPFLSYITKLKEYPSSEQIFCVFLSILHGLADPSNEKSWIYNPDELPYIDYKLMVEEKTGFIPSINYFVDPDKFRTPENMQAIQLSVIWLWSKEE